jgi:hypothetical protein
MIAPSEQKRAISKIVGNQRRNEPPCCHRLAHHLAFTKSAQEPNGIKLAPARLRYQLLTQCVPGFDHQGEGLGSSLFDARLHAMRADGVDE